MSHVAGFCVVNDLSERAFQLEGHRSVGEGQERRHVWPDRTMARDDGRGRRLPESRSVARGGRPSLPERHDEDDGVRRPVPRELSEPIHEPAVRATSSPPARRPVSVTGMKPPVFLRAGNVMRLGVDGLGEQRQRVVDVANSHRFAKSMPALGLDRSGPHGNRRRRRGADARRRSDPLQLRRHGGVEGSGRLRSSFRERPSRSPSACGWRPRVGTPIVTRGSGTGLERRQRAEPWLPGPLPHADGRDSRRRSRNLTLRAQPGAINQRIDEAAGRHGLFYPPDPGSQRISTIGGNVAENSGGLRGLKYGVTRDYVMALEVVLADGQVARLGSACVKDVAGYSLKDLFIGSEGTLGIITEVLLKLLPRPAARRTMLALYDQHRGRGRDRLRHRRGAHHPVHARVSRPDDGRVRRGLCARRTCRPIAKPCC